MEKTDKGIELTQVEKALKEIKKESDLKKFRDEKGKTFCEKYKIEPMQLNFLVSVVAAERIKIIC